MGLFDKFKDKNNKVPKKMLPYRLELREDDEGKMQIDFIDKNVEDNTNYDTTRIIIDKEKAISLKTENGENETINLKDCRIAWYSYDNVSEVDMDGTEWLRGTEYKRILTVIDTNLLQNDPDYCITVMKDLLNKQRVMKYLNYGLMENSDIHCGRYIGSIVNTKKDGYRKYFDQRIGELSHNSQEMIVQRNREIKRRQNTNKQKRINEAEKEIERLINDADNKEVQKRIAKLVDEIEDLSR